MPLQSVTRLPFDYYGRYRLAAEVVEAVTAPGGRVLDVGGGAGMLSAFLDDRDVVCCDLSAPGDARVAATTLVLADGTRLPFADGTFEAVVSLDTLEHVEAPVRDRLLDEAARVARDWVLVICPCATDGVADADSALLAYVRQRFGEEFATVEVLTEHLSFGHPDPERVAGRLRAAGGDVACLPSGRLDRWLPMMILFYELMSLGRDDPVERVQAWYNERHWRDDLRAPSYRQAFLARLGQGPAPADIAARILPGDAAVKGATLGLEGLQLALTEPLRRSVGDLQARNDELEDQLAEARRRAAASSERAHRAEEQVRRLLEFRRRVLAHPAVRVRNALRWRGGPPGAP